MRTFTQVASYSFAHRENPRRKRYSKWLCCCILLLLIPALVQGQVTATINGTITDQTGAAVQNAKVEFQDLATGGQISTTTGPSGAFAISNVAPGTYKATVSASGFKTTTITSFDVAVGKGATLNVKLNVGGTTETVEVLATGLELQTLDASVGNVLNQEALERLPSLNRDATALLLLQPMTTPGYNGAPGSGEGNLTGGTVAGARADQNTFLLDGGDATSNTEGGGGYANQSGSGFAATPRAAVPTPVESLQEFRVTTNNSNLFSRSAGGEVQMVTRRGTNAWHGSVYENIQNSDFNANTWENNHTKQPRPIWIDNRFGAKVGGPIVKDRAFFFLMYEGRRQKRGVPLGTRLVPSTLLKQGILQFKDATGAVRQYNLATSTLCSGGACDPRGKGISPVISKIWGFMPNGNDVSQGDGLNTLGFVSSVPVVVNDDFAVGRLDYKLSQNWDVNSSFRYAVSDGVGSGQVDIGGLTKGATKGVPVATRTLPTQPRYLSLGLTGRLSNVMTNDFHFNWLRHWWQWQPVSPFPQVSGLGAAVQIFAESRSNGLVPLNIDTQNARARVWNGKDYTWSDNLSWLRGSHFFQFGGEARHERFFHSRDDKVVGALTSPVYFATRGSEITVSSAFRPPACGGGVSTNCLLSGDVSRWNNLYAAVTGMISRASQLRTRASDLTPNPAGVPNLQDSIVNAYDLYFTDSWKLKPSFTFTYGLGWSVQMPPYESKGRQTIMIDTATGKPILLNNYFTQLSQAASQGKTFVPTLGFAPIRTTNRKYPYDPDYSNIEPRVSFAWNPSFGESFLGRLLGERKSVIRGGYGRYHDRLNGVGIVMTPALGVGFGNTVNCRRVQISGACGTSNTDPNTAFRIGVDGSTVALPNLTNVKPPIIPGSVTGANSPLETLDFRIDPHRQVGVEDTWTLSIQRELPARTLVELGYVGRVAHHLYGAKDINQIPYMFKAGGQTFAQAFDAVARQIRANPNINPSAVTPQPWYETMLAGNCAGFPSCTAFMLASNGLGEFSNVLDGIVNDHWANIDSNFPTGLFPTLPIDQQLIIEQMTSSEGNSNYHAGYVSLRKQTSHGLMFQVNYSLSHAMDTVGFTQENVFISPSDNFNKNRDYGPSQFDRRHTFNGFFVYDLPFGRDQRFSTRNWLDRVIGGWSVSGAFTASSGIPLDPINGASCEEFGSGSASGICSAMIPLKGGLSAKAHYNFDGKGNVSMFGDPNAAANNFRRLFFSDARTGHGVIRSFNRWNMDAALNKTTSITERVKFGLSLSAVNVFNHMEFQDPPNSSSVTTDISNPDQFGVTGVQYSSPRFLNISVRLDF
jgi:hypothetical protein